LAHRVILRQRSTSVAFGAKRTSTVAAAFIWLKNRDPERWRDAQQVEHALGKYIISDHPMTEAQWAAERATVINDVVEELPAPEK
jgi:hypothetical protein